MRSIKTNREHTELGFAKHIHKALRNYWSNPLPRESPNAWRAIGGVGEMIVWMLVSLCILPLR